MKKEITINGEKYIKAECEEKKKSPYELEGGDVRYWLAADGDFIRDSGYIDDRVKMKLEQGNIFRTKQEAQHERDKREAIFKIKKYIYDNFGYDPTDWADWHNTRKKGFIYYNATFGKFDWYITMDDIYYSPIGHLKTKDQAQEIIDNFEEELKIIFDIK